MLKQALYLACRDYPTIRNALSGIIFLSTPHLTNIEDERWANWRLMLRLFRKDVSKTALRKEDIELLANVCERFNGLYLRTPIMSVFEEIKTKIRDTGPIGRFRTVEKQV